METKFNLDNKTSLQIFCDDSIIFKSSSKWLFPLFELEEFFEKMQIVPQNCILHDKIAGAAAAFLISRMGFSKCHIDLISQKACAVFEKYNVEYSYSTIVDKIQCRTEGIINENMHSDEVYFLLKKRAGLFSGVSLNISELNISYGKNTVLKNMDLELKSGEHIIITGDNGSGKTTLLKAIIGAVPFNTGKILINGKDNSKASSKLIGYVNQIHDNKNFPLAASEVVAMGLAGQKISGKALQHRVEISMRRTDSFHLAKRNFYSLSGGEKQRISLARCLCQNAGLILMDEPTSFLDSSSKDDLLHVLTDITKRHAPTILIVSHDHEWISKIGWKSGNLHGGKLCLK